MSFFRRGGVPASLSDWNLSTCLAWLAKGGGPSELRFAIEIDARMLSEPNEIFPPRFPRLFQPLQLPSLWNLSTCPSSPQPARTRPTTKKLGGISYTYYCLTFSISTPWQCVLPVYFQRKLKKCVFFVFFGRGAASQPVSVLPVYLQQKLKKCVFLLLF